MQYCLSALGMSLILHAFGAQRCSATAAQIQTQQCMAHPNRIQLPIAHANEVQRAIERWGHSTRPGVCSSSGSVAPYLGQFPLHANFLGVSSNALAQHFRVLDSQLHTNASHPTQSAQDAMKHLGECLAGCPPGDLPPVVLLTASFKRNLSIMHNLDRLTTGLMLGLQSLGHCMRIIAIQSIVSAVASTTSLAINPPGAQPGKVCTVQLSNALRSAKHQLHIIGRHLGNWSVILNDISLQATSRAVVLSAKPTAFWLLFNNQQAAFLHTAPGEPRRNIPRVVHPYQVQARQLWADQLQPVLLQASTLEHVIPSTQVSSVSTSIQLLHLSGLAAKATEIESKRTMLVNGPLVTERQAFTFVLPHNEGKMHFLLTPALVAIALASLAHDQNTQVPTTFKVWMHSQEAFSAWLDQLVSSARSLLRGVCAWRPNAQCCTALGPLATLYSQAKHHCCDLLRLVRQLSLKSVLIHLKGMFNLVPHLPHADYFRELQRASLYLDSHPVGGGTTSMDALFLGLPVVTKPSSTDAGRLATSHYLAMGLTANAPRFGCGHRRGGSEISLAAGARGLRLIALSWAEYVAHALWHFEHPAESRQVGRLLAKSSEVLFNDMRAATAWSTLIQAAS